LNEPATTVPLLQRLRPRVGRLLTRVGLADESRLVLLSILVGAATGFFAKGFFDLLGWFHRQAYGSGGIYDGRVWMLLVLPAVGALAVGCLTFFFAKEAKGHGVPEVMDAIHRSGGRIRPRVAVVKALSSALTIGSGGSAGMEGPIVQIGAAIGSSAGQVLGVPRRQMGILVASGVAAGISAIFNAPIAGVLFALEVFLREFSFRTFSPVVVSSVISCTIMHSLRGEDAAIFEVAALRGNPYMFIGTELPFYLGLGLACALAAVAFIRVLYWVEDISDRVRVPHALKPAIGAGLMGATGVVYVLVVAEGGAPPFFGNGYPMIAATIGEKLFDMTVVGLLVLMLLKLVATTLTLGSGGSGGIFAPSLLLGAAVGGAFGLTLQTAGLIHAPSVGAYALVGMAATVAGTTHAPLTAIVMLYEMTREPRVVLPVMFAAMVALAGARLLCQDSIYTLKLRRRGVRVGSLADLTILRRITVADVDRQPVTFVHVDDPLRRLLDIASESDATDFVVVDSDGKYKGLVCAEDIKTTLFEPEAVDLLVVGELLRPGVPTIPPDETLDVLLDRFSNSDVDSVPICSPHDPTRIEGLVTRRAVIRRYRQELDRHSG